MKIYHLTSAHKQEDIRIFHKECASLADAGYEVYQISSGNTYDNKSIHLIGTRCYESRGAYAGKCYKNMRKFKGVEFSGLHNKYRRKRK